MDFKFKYLFVVEAAVAVLLCESVVLCGSVSAERRRLVHMDRLDGLSLDWVIRVSDDHHLPDPMQPFLAIARYLQGTSN